MRLRALAQWKCNSSISLPQASQPPPSPSSCLQSPHCPRVSPLEEFSPPSPASQFRRSSDLLRQRITIAPRRTSTTAECPLKRWPQSHRLISTNAWTGCFQTKPIRLPWPRKCRSKSSDSRTARVEDQCLRETTRSRSFVPRSQNGAYSSDVVPGFDGQNERHTRASGAAKRQTERSAPELGITKGFGSDGPDQTGNTGIFVTATAQRVRVLEDQLRNLARRSPNLTETTQVLTAIVQESNALPTSFHYEALLMANCDPERGSASNVKQIIEEVAARGHDKVQTSTYCAALQALAVHPDKTLVLEIMQSLLEQQNPIAPEAFSSVAAAYIRLDQLELAGKVLDLMHATNTAVPFRYRKTIPSHVMVMYLQALATRRDWEAVIHFIYDLHDRIAMEMEIPSTMFAWLLTYAAADGEAWVTNWVWQNYVERMRIRPTRETCLNVLGISARDGVDWLAESVQTYIECVGPCQRPFVVSATEPTTRSSFRIPTDANGMPLFEEPAGEITAQSSTNEGGQTETATESNVSCFVLTSVEEELLMQAQAKAKVIIRSWKQRSNSLADGKELATEEGEELESTRRTLNPMQRQAHGKDFKKGQANLWPIFNAVEGYYPVGGGRFDPWDTFTAGKTSRRK